MRACCDVYRSAGGWRRRLGGWGRRPRVRDWALCARLARATKRSAPSHPSASHLRVEGREFGLRPAAQSETLSDWRKGLETKNSESLYGLCSGLRQKTWPTASSNPAPPTLLLWIDMIRGGGAAKREGGREGEREGGREGGRAGERARDEGRDRARALSCVIDLMKTEKGRQYAQLSLLLPSLPWKRTACQLF